MSSAKTTVLEVPDLKTAGNELINARDAGKFITLLGRCRVLYTGRGGSDLEAGDRHVMLKPDGTVIVHSHDLFKPRNYQPPGATYTARMDDDDELTVHVERTKGSTKEIIDIMFSDIYVLTTTQMDDDADLNLVGTEQDMQDYLADNPMKIAAELGVGFRVIDTEYSIDVGNIDIFGQTDDSTPVIVELKRRRVGPKAVDQLRRYIDEYQSIDSRVIGVLVAPSVTESALEMLHSHDFHFVEFKPKSLIERPQENLKLDAFSESDPEL
jgi:RecB family endonuclease NucS